MVKILTLLTLPLFGICASFANDGFDIVSNGQAKTEIVLPVRANRIEKYAAGELSEHIRKSTGVLLPIVRENRLKGDMPRIWGKPGSLYSTGSTPADCRPMPI